MTSEYNRYYALVRHKEYNNNDWYIVYYAGRFTVREVRDHFIKRGFDVKKVYTMDEFDELGMELWTDER